MWLYNLLTDPTFLTIISGVIVFILGQLFIEYFLRPLQRYRELRAKAAYCLVFYANRFNSSFRTNAQETQDELRKLAAELAAFAVEKPLIVLPRSRKCLNDASSYFIGLSNCTFDDTNYQMICKDLREYRTQIR